MLLEDGSGRYRTKPVFVNAFQLLEGNRYDEDSWPDWMKEAWNRDIDDDYALIGNSNNHTLFIGIFPDISINYGDWIIREENGHLFSFSAEEFENKFESIHAENDD